jgi:asparagine synthase (glutamine-hydrolysing)
MNPEYLAEYLTAFTLRQEGETVECAEQGANRVLPGQIVTLSLASGNVVEKCQRNWDERVVEPQSHEIEEAANEFRDALKAAVRQRMQGNTVAHVSGGIDSTGIACMAQELFTTELNCSKLRTESLVYNRLVRLARETYYLDLAAERLQATPSDRLEADGLLNFDGFESPPPHDEPYAGLWQLEAEQVLIEHAHSVGAQSVLTGVGADEVHDNAPFVLADECRVFRLRSAWRKSCEAAGYYSVSPWKILMPFGIQPAWWRWLSRRNSLLFCRSYNRLIPSWIRPAFATKYNFVSRVRDNLRRQYGHTTLVNMAVAICAVRDRAGGMARWNIGAPLGVHVTHPFLDPRVVGLGLGIRQSLSFPMGQQKPLLARVFAPWLPDEILQRRKKGNFDEVYYLGLARHRDALHRLISDTAEETEEFLDQAALHEYLDTAVLGGLRSDQLQSHYRVLAVLRWMIGRRIWIQARDCPDVKIQLEFS